MRRIIFDENSNKNILNYKEFFSLFPKFTPKFLYFPLKTKYHTFDKLIVEVGQVVAAGDKLALDREKGLNYLSSLPGKVVEISDRVVVEVSPTGGDEIKLAPTISRAELVERVKYFGLVGMGGGGFPTYQKLNFGTSKLIINACECEPGITSDTALVLNYQEEIKKAIFLMEGLFAEIFIAVKSDSPMITTLEACQSEKIKLMQVNDTYPVGSDRLLAGKILGSIDYSKHIADYDMISLNIATIFSIYQISTGIFSLSRVVSVGRDKEIKNLVVPYGAKVADILAYLGLELAKDEVLISGGVMMGSEIDENHTISARDTALLLVEVDDSDEVNCINCSKCEDVCPTGLSPQILFQEGIFARDKEQMLLANNINACIECALCSYVCPSNIDLAKYFNKFKKDLRASKAKREQEAYHESRREAKKQRMKAVGRI